MTRCDDGTRGELSSQCLSIGGVLLAGPGEGLALGTTVKLQLGFGPGEAVDLTGTVVHLGQAEDGNKLVGVRFARVSRLNERLAAEAHQRAGSSDSVPGPLPLASFRDWADKQAFMVAHPQGFFVVLDRNERPEQLAPDSLVHVVRSRSGAGPWQSVSLGRSHTCDVVIDHPRVSRRHAVLERNLETAEQLLLDLGTSNGTSIDGIRLANGQPARLCSGSVVLLGRLPLLFLDAETIYDAAQGLAGNNSSVADRLVRGGEFRKRKKKPTCFGFRS